MAAGERVLIREEKLTGIVDSLFAPSFDIITFTSFVNVSFLASLTRVATGACALLILLFAVARFQSPLLRVFTGAAVPLARFTIITTINLGFICVTVCFQLSFAVACRKTFVGGYG